MSDVGENHKEDWVRLGDEVGQIKKVDVRGRNIWVWFPNTEEYVMFSYRNDLNWRAFPGPADGPTLEFDIIPSKAIRSHHKKELVNA